MRAGWLKCRSASSVLYDLNAHEIEWKIPQHSCKTKWVRILGIKKHALMSATKMRMLKVMNGGILRDRLRKICLQKQLVALINE